MTLPRRALLGAVALAPFAAASRAAPALALIDEELPGEPLYAAALHDLDDAPARLPRPGTPLIVNFWARWCGPCKVEIPELVALNARNSGVMIVGIAVEDRGAPVRDFARAYDIDYTVLLARGSSGLDLMRQLGNPKAGLPFTLALDRLGRVVARRLGAISREQLDQAVRLALR